MQIHKFTVIMSVPDDDQTDPEEMADILENVLNDRGSAIGDYTNGLRDMDPMARPTFAVVQRT